MAFTKKQIGALFAATLTVAGCSPATRDIQHYTPYPVPGTNYHPTGNVVVETPRSERVIQINCKEGFERFTYNGVHLGDRTGTFTQNRWLITNASDRVIGQCPPPNNQRLIPPIHDMRDALGLSRYMCFYWRAIASPNGGYRLEPAVDSSGRQMRSNCGPYLQPEVLRVYH